MKSRYLLAALQAGAWIMTEQVARSSEDTRREVQLQLRKAGFYFGEIDGKIGPQTRAAMVEFARTG